MKNIKFALLILLVLGVHSVNSQRIMEKLDRGLVAVRTSSTKVFLSWRILGTDPSTISFNLYRDGTKVNDVPISSISNYSDTNGNLFSKYTVKAIIDGTEIENSDEVSIWSANYLDIPLSIPDSMTMPDGSTCGYVANDMSTADLDGDGKLDYVLKWDPTNAKDNSQSGYTGNVYLDGIKSDGTKLWRIDLGKNIRAGAHYTQFQVADYDGDGHAEIICKTAPNAKDGKGKFLNMGPAASASHSLDYRNSGGYILTGPEYLTVFDGITGEELDTENYIPARGTVSNWGDSYGNRVDRFLAATAWVDGVLPSAIMCRGYYTRAALVAWDFRNGELKMRWNYDSGNSKTTTNLYGQGNHNMSVGDVDFDGKDEILWNSGALDDDGTFLYRTGLGHGDAMHFSDLDPNRKGYEMWSVHEETGATYGQELHDARTGKIIWGTYTGTDNGRGMAGNIVKNNEGFEMWSSSVSGIADVNGNSAGTSRPSINFRIYWDGDLQDELLDGNTISKYGAGNLLSASGCSSNNGTKSTPALSADIFGDWREELILRKSDNSALRIFTTTIYTSNGLYTLMHEPAYRSAITWQNTAYNQPPHVGFYMGDEMEKAPISSAYNGELIRTAPGEISSTGWTQVDGSPVSYSEGSNLLFDLRTDNSSSLQLSSAIQPKSLKFYTPKSLSIEGEGMISGSTGLDFFGESTLTLNNDNDYTGKTQVWNATLINNGKLSNSEVYLYNFATIGGNGNFKSITAGKHASINPGHSTGAVGNMKIAGDFKTLSENQINFDFTESNNDTITVGGVFNMSNQTTFNLNFTGPTVVGGNYVLIQCDSLIGDLSKILINANKELSSYAIQFNNKQILLLVKQPENIIWTGSESANWDQGLSSNFSLDSEKAYFFNQDSVVFGQEGLYKNLTLLGELSPSYIRIQDQASYTFRGTGTINGTTDLVVESATLNLSNTNSYTGRTIINNGTLQLSTLKDAGIASPIGSATAITSNLQLNNSILKYTGMNAETNRGMTITGDNEINISFPTATIGLNGAIVGTGKLIKKGSGSLSLSGANSYAGGLSIQQGTVQLNPLTAYSTGSGSGNLDVLDGAKLTGSGNVNGDITIKSGGTFSPGPGKVTVLCRQKFRMEEGATLNIDVTTNPTTSSKIYGLSSVTVDGKLNIVTPTGFTFMAGDELQVIQSTNIAGRFDEITPATPPAASGTMLDWDLSELYTSGKLKIKLYTTTKKLNTMLNPKVGPNPFDDFIHISIPDGSNGRYSIFDITGKMVSQNSIYNPVKLNVSHLKPGIYILKFILNDGLVTSHKLIKQ